MTKPTWYLVDGREEPDASCHHCPFVILDANSLNNCERICTAEAIKAGHSSGLFMFIRDPQLYIKARLLGQNR